MIELAVLALWLLGPALVGLGLAALATRAVRDAAAEWRFGVALVLLLVGALVAVSNPASSGPIEKGLWAISMTIAGLCVALPGLLLIISALHGLAAGPGGRARLLKALLVAAAVAAPVAVLIGMAASGGLHYTHREDAYADHFLFATQGHAGKDAFRIAEATTWADPPLNMPLDKRLRTTPQLVTLRYQVLDQSGLLVQTVEVRALVPAYGSQLGQCTNDACQQATRGAKVQWVHDGGASGIADEWLLRMPQGVAFELPTPPEYVRDLRADRPTQLLGPRQRRGAYRVTVTLDQACPVRAFIMTDYALAVPRRAVVPLPTQWQTSTWTQIEGCEKLPPLPAAQSRSMPPPPLPTTEPAPAISR